MHVVDTSQAVPQLRQPGEATTRYGPHASVVIYVTLGVQEMRRLAVVDLVSARPYFPFLRMKSKCGVRNVGGKCTVAIIIPRNHQMPRSQHAMFAAIPCCCTFLLLLAVLSPLTSSSLET